MGLLLLIIILVLLFGGGGGYYGYRTYGGPGLGGVLGIIVVILLDPLARWRARSVHDARVTCSQGASCFT